MLNSCLRHGKEDYNQCFADPEIAYSATSADTVRSIDKRYLHL